MLDVGAVAHRLLATGWTPPVDVPRETLCALVALHDIGKFTRSFQAKRPDLWPESALGLFCPPPPVPHHDAAGLEILSVDLKDRTTRLFSDGRSRTELLRATTGHHGSPPEAPPPEWACFGLAARPEVFCSACRDAAAAAFDLITTTIGHTPLPCLDDRSSATLAWWLAGFTMVCDWIGSAETWFPYEPESEDPASYWKRSIEKAERAVREAGVLPSASGGTGRVSALFPAITAPTPLQAWAETWSLPDGPALVIAEDVTGSGKTEAALTLAQRMLLAGKGQGLYFALPTMATASAMYDRLAESYRRLFAPGTLPSVVLAHGRSGLHEGFRNSILEAVREGAAGGVSPADEPAGAQCAQWVADDRRRSLLADVGVGTIDQALLAVLPARHAPMRLLGLSAKILILDEVHAYDSYMSAEAERLLEFHAALGGSAILLSATLPRTARKRLLDAFALGLGKPETQAGHDPSQASAYPLVSWRAAQQAGAEPIRASERSCRTVVVERVGTVAEVVKRIRTAIARGAAVAWVRNAVDDVLESAEELEDLAPIVFHARMAMGDRLEIERQVLRRFGRTSGPAERHGRLVVATQVIEQSLDLDFDLLVSDLAPVDLVIQRAGRLWRHRREDRPLDSPRLLLLSPDPDADVGADWVRASLPRTASVYDNPGLLWRSARALLAEGVIRTPANIRQLVEEVYDPDGAVALPAALVRQSAEAEGREKANGAFADMTLLKLASAYRRGSEWSVDTRVRTRLENQPQVIVRLAKEEAGRWVPWCDDPDERRAWALSEVRLPEGRMKEVGIVGATSGLFAEVRSAWPAWERDIPLAVVSGPGQEGPCAVRIEGRETGWTYDRRSGLRFGLRASRPAG